MTNNISVPQEGAFHLSGQLVILVSNSMSHRDFVTLRDTLCSNRFPLVFSPFPGKDDAFILHAGNWRLALFEHSGSYMFNTAKQLKRNDSQKSANDAYRRLFLLYPKDKILLLYQNNSYFLSPYQEEKQSRSVLFFPRNLGTNMNSGEYNAFLDKMRRFFEDRPVPKKDFQVPDRMSALVLTPFQNYTDAEKRVLQLLSLKDPIPFSGYAPLSSLCYRFTLTSKKVSFKNGDWIRVCRESGQPFIVGVVSDYDQTASTLTLHFLAQFSAEKMPQTGTLELAANNQYRIRTAVLNAFRAGTVAATHAYETFGSFTTQPYSSPEPELISFLQSLLSGSKPPNHMQMEAIIKGILTKDMLLVLGPPGTGKTTVIRSWVQYFLQKGVRVLISAHSNAAVDNVLERFGDCGEVVRLGKNEEKIQENCRRFMPKYKIQAMQERCQENTDRAQQLLQQDTDALNCRLQAIDTYLQTARPLLDARTTLLDEAAPLQKTADQLWRLYSKYLPLRKQADALRQTIREKNVYLQKNSRRNFFLRLLTGLYTLFVKCSLSSARKKLEALQAQLSGMATRYRSAMTKLKQQRDDLRKSAAYQRYFQVKAPLDDLNSRLFCGDTALPSLALTSALRSLYTPCSFQKSALKNIALCLREYTVLQQLSNSSSKIRFALQQWNAAAQSSMRNDIFQEILLNSCQIVGATTMGINATPLFSGLDFGVTIIDESGQIPVHDALIPISRAPKTLMLGDYQQISPVVTKELQEACQGIDTTLLKSSFFEFLFHAFSSRYNPNGDTCPQAFSRYDPTDKSSEALQYLADQVVRQNYPFVSLTHQFRMPGCISDLVAPWFYHGNYHSCYDMSLFCPLIPGTKDPLLVIDTSADPERADSAINRGSEADTENTSYLNRREAELTVQVVDALLRSMDPDARSHFLNPMTPGMGIIVPYEPQVLLIRSLLQSRLGLTAEQGDALVRTLDSFQGQERQLIIFNFVRSTIAGTDREIPNIKSRIGFMKDMRRLNVAITRTQNQLVIIGDMTYLTNCRYIKSDGDFCYQTAPCYEETDETISLPQAEQCAGCPAVCDRRLARFLKWILSHLNPGAGISVSSENLEKLLKGEQL